MAHGIVIWPDGVLDTPTERVEEFGPALDALLERMMKALLAAEGAGIAANQIGVSKRVAWVADGAGSFFEIVNPEILEQSEKVVLEEGCLSVPGEWHEVPRFRVVKVRYQDRSGAWHERTAEDRLAHVFQHEIDHLDGKVFLHRLSALKRDLVRRKMRRLKRAEEEAAQEGKA